MDTPYTTPEAPLDVRATTLSTLHAHLRRAFIAFVTVFLVRVGANIFVFARLKPGDPGLAAYVWAAYILFAALLVTYVVLAVYTCRTVIALGRSADLHAAYFFFLPLVVFGLSKATQLPLGFIIGNAILGSPIAVYLLLANELEGELREESRLI